MKILLVAIIALVFVGFSIQDSFAANPEFVSVITQNASTKSLNSNSNIAQVSINTDALKAEKINLSVFGETIEITHIDEICKESFCK